MIFSHSVGSLSLWLMVSFGTQKMSISWMLCINLCSGVCANKILFRNFFSHATHQNRCFSLTSWAILAVSGSTQFFQEASKFVQLYYKSHKSWFHFLIYLSFLMILGWNILHLQSLKIVSILIINMWFRALCLFCFSDVNKIWEFISNQHQNLVFRTLN